ncbi:transketolase, thiamine pyrophosphate-binding domain protein [Propionibacterium acidifaciens F0233]|uniref:Transketolase, thiamine pyrophosphate-binding domain protein n=1 Tax=Propionibacterium acidifaciens F0233 TaxID=553198 RepID=U2Q7W6_9ACTN|nr:transketolase [Propionibacterium acidifaciens]AYW78233.1 transketolase [Propionibacterium acidifaciens]ERK52456.1 transketolase, thiamine pyrophosphate-binding domain protein [Propionibacterium acidifaciens F0233]
MTTNREPITPERLETLRMAAYRIRRNALREAEVQGEGYIGQALGLSDVLAALYVDQARIDPRNPEWEDRDRVLVSMGHYGLAIYAALVEIGMIPEDELDTYATDDSRLPMSAMASYTPGVEISGGSLGHGLVIANGIALGLKRKGNTGNVCYNVLSDGELDEGSTWEAAQTAAHFRLDNLIAIVDFNNQQADGRSQEIMGTESIDGRFRAFGWETRRCDGNDLGRVVELLEELRHGVDSDRPRCLVVDTRLAKGVDFLETREKLHFMRVAPQEWAVAQQHLKEAYGL